MYNPKLQYEAKNHFGLPERIIDESLIFLFTLDSMKPPANHVAMMQIDCEVMNTRLIYIKNDAIPSHMSANMKGSNASLQRNESGHQGASRHMHTASTAAVFSNPDYESYEKSPRESIQNENEIDVTFEHEPKVRFGNATPYKSKRTRGRHDVYRNSKMSANENE